MSLFELSWTTSAWVAVAAGISAALVYVLGNWRLCLLCFGIHTVTVFITMNARGADVGWAALPMLVGGLASLMLFLSARRVRWGDRQESRRWWTMRTSRGERWPLLSTSLLLRSVVVLVSALVMLRAQPTLDLPKATPDQGLICIWLWFVGFLAIASSEEPLRVGLGLMLLFSGGQLYFSTTGGSPTVLGLVYGLELMVALAVSGLVLARGAVRRPSVARHLHAKSSAISTPGADS